MKPAPIDLKAVVLTPEEGFVLSRLDGPVDAAQIAGLTGLAPDRVDAIVARLVEVGALIPGGSSTPSALPSLPPGGNVASRSPGEALDPFSGADGLGAMPRMPPAPGVPKIAPPSGAARPGGGAPRGPASQRADPVMAGLPEELLPPTSGRLRLPPGLPALFDPGVEAEGADAPGEPPMPRGTPVAPAPLRSEQASATTGLPEGVTPYEGEGLPDGVTPYEGEGLPEGVTPYEGEGLPEGVTPYEGEGLPEGVTPYEGEGLPEGVTPHEDEGPPDGVAPAEGEGPAAPGPSSLGDVFAAYAAQFRRLPPAERRAIAKDADDPDLLTLCLDPDPVVIGAVLANPRSGLFHARRIALHHRSSAGIDLLCRRAELFRDSLVQRNLLRNPQLAETILQRITAGKQLADVHKLCLDREIPEPSRLKLRADLRRRFGNSSADEKVELVMRTEGRVLSLLSGCTFDAKSAATLAQRTISSLVLVQNLARFPATPPVVLARLVALPMVSRQPAIKQLVLRHPNLPGDAKRRA